MKGDGALFVEESLAAISDAPSRRRFEAVLRKWAGYGVNVPAGAGLPRREVFAAARLAAGNSPEQVRLALRANYSVRERSTYRDIAKARRLLAENGGAVPQETPTHGTDELAALQVAVARIARKLERHE